MLPEDSRPFHQTRVSRTDFPVNERYDTRHKFKNAHVSLDTYKQLYEESISNPEVFWGRMAKENLSWFRDFSKVMVGELAQGNMAWFLNGSLNASYNCIDRHLDTRGDQTAILWEGDDPSAVRKISYNELFAEVCKLANALKRLGVKKGDVVAIYMPMVPEAAIAMLACARIGAVHTVVFAGFSSNSLRQRIVNSSACVLLTANEGLRGGRHINLKKTVNDAVAGCPTIRNVVVFKRTDSEEHWNPKIDLWWHDVMEKERPYCPPAHMDSEDPLFLLYTSGSTGSPKGMEHTTAGYLLFTALTHKYIFDYKPGDIYACVADIGWITGHSYIVYGPLVNGATTFMFESLPNYPNYSRYWDMIQRHKITQFYTAPTAIRTLMKEGEEPLKGYDLSSLRILGSVGEPINPRAWKWYYEHVGKSNCAIVDTYWQTETGGIVLSPLPGVNPTKPGSATIPFFGIKPEILNQDTGKPIEGNDIQGILAISTPWPGLARTVFNDHKRYMDTYLNVFPGYYFTGDGCYRDEDGYYWIIGRVDDVIDRAGHRLGTAEIEGALVSHTSCTEAAVIAIPEEIKGEAIWAYCTIASDQQESKQLIEELKLAVAQQIGKIAVPDRIILTSQLPKTRSGKIIRRLLKSIAQGKTSASDLGDTSTLADPGLISILIEKSK